MTRADRAKQVADLAAQGLNGIQIANKLGISRSYAYELLTDPDGREVRARKDRYRLPCPRCGKPMDGSNGRTGAPRFCLACDQQDAKENLQRRASVTGAPRLYTDRELIFALRMAAAGRPSVSLNEYRRVRDCSPVSTPAEETIMQRFGSWNDALIAAGLQLNRPYADDAHYDRQRVGRDACLRAISSYAGDLGRLPTSREYEACSAQEGWPSLGTIRNYFGTWNAAIAELHTTVDAFAA